MSILKNMFLWKDGCLELMVHRRLLDDDHFGVGEALDEIQFGKGLVARGKHLLVIHQDKAEFNKALRCFPAHFLLYLSQADCFTRVLPTNCCLRREGDGKKAKA